MVRLYELYHVIIKLLPSELGFIIAEYADFVDQEKIMFLLERASGKITFTGNQQYFPQLLSFRIHPWEHGYICINDGFNDAREQKIPIVRLLKQLRSRFWASDKPMRRKARLAPLWQEFYDLWARLDVVLLSKS